MQITQGTVARYLNIINQLPILSNNLIIKLATIPCAIHTYSRSSDNDNTVKVML